MQASILIYQHSSFVFSLSQHRQMGYRERMLERKLEEDKRKLDKEERETDREAESQHLFSVFKTALEAVKK